MMRRLLTAALLGILAGTPSAAQAQGASWHRVDSLRAGTDIIVTLASGQQREGRFEGATSTEIVVGDVRLAKASILTISRRDRLRDGAKWGAFAGAGALAAPVTVSYAACRLGCEAGGPGPLPPALFGAGIGAAVGLLVDRFNGGDEILYPAESATSAPRFFRDGVSVRLGPTVSHLAFRSMDEAAVARGMTVAVQVARYLTVHAEYALVDHTYHAPPGTVPDDVLENLVPAAGRIAGWRRGLESSHVSYQFSELAGVQLPAWGRIRVEVLGGVTVQATATRNYYDAYERTGIGTRESPLSYRRLPGKYSALTFETPDFGLLAGVDAEIAVARGLVVVPTARYHRFNDPGPALSLGAGVQWRF